MREARGNLWDLAQPGEVLVITTNGFVKRNGEAVMGRGIALEATQRCPGIQRTLGRKITAQGNHAHGIGKYKGIWLVSMPVKHHWSDEADPDLIVRSAHQLVAMADQFYFDRVWLPRPGCGNGRLKWVDVHPLIDPILDDRFVVVTF